jgi:hypothetical protein
MRTIELTDHTYHEDEQGRWTMDMPEFGLRGEPVYFEDVVDAVQREQGKEAARQLDRMHSMREQ